MPEIQVVAVLPEPVVFAVVDKAVLLPISVQPLRDVIAPAAPGATL